MKEIQLTQGQVALVDDEDYDRLSAYNWFASYSKGTGSFYAQTKVRIGDSVRTIPMSRATVLAPCGKIVDHEDHDTLNNQRYNLRITTQSGNMKNKRMHRTNSSGMCGVWWNAMDRKWVSYATVDGRRVSLGSFNSKDEAMEARSLANGRYAYHENHGSPAKIKERCVATFHPRDRRTRSDNSSGIVGVSWHKHKKRWMARISVDGESKTIGYFREKYDAECARQEALRHHGFVK